MRNIVPLWAYFACMGYGWQVQTSAQASLGRALNELDALAKLLMAFNQAAVFNPSAPAMHRPLAEGHLARFHSGQRIPVMSTDDEAEEKRKEELKASLFSPESSTENSNSVKNAVEQGSDEKAMEFYKQAAEAAAVAKSEESIAALRTLAKSAVAELQGNAKLTEALEKKTTPSGEVAKALVKPEGTIAIIGEITKCEENEVLFSGSDIEDPQFLSEEFRSGGASAVLCNLLYDTAIGTDTVKKVAREQKIAKGEYPGPIPTIARAPIVDPLQLAQVALDGAAAAVISLAVAGKEKSTELMAAADGLGLESLIRITSEEELSIALDLGAKMIVFGEMDQAEAAAVIKKVPSGILTIYDFPYLGVRGAWQIRDLGFNALMTGKSLLEDSVTNRVPPAAQVKALRSKGSTAYGNGMDNTGRGEGAKELLGTIAY